MNNKVREYLEKIEMVNAQVRQEEKKLSIHKEVLENNIKILQEEYADKAKPILEVIRKKIQERAKYEKTIKEQLSVNAYELLNELNRTAELKGIDQARMTINISSFGEHLTKEDLKKKIEFGSIHCENCFKITIQNLEYENYRKFMYCKSINLGNNIKFSDGSDLIDNLELTHSYSDGLKLPITNIKLTEEGERKLMLNFAPEELIHNGFLFKPVNLLKTSVLNILEKQNPTM